MYTHGMNRFPRVVRMIRAGRIDIHAVPELAASHGALERWNGKHGVGNPWLTPIGPGPPRSNATSKRPPGVEWNALRLIVSTAS